jgi:hypothetical protein
MGEPQQSVLPCAARRVAGEAVVEHVDEANFRATLQRTLDLRARDRLVVGGFDLPDRLEPDDTVGSPSSSSIIRARSASESGRCLLEAGF